MNCSNKCGKTCHDKSCQRYYNNNAQTIEVGGATQLVIKGNKVVDSGISIETESQNYTVVKKGLYHISADVVIDGTTLVEIVGANVDVGNIEVIHNHLLYYIQHYRLLSCSSIRFIVTIYCVSKVFTIPPSN